MRHRISLCLLLPLLIAQPSAFGQSVADIAHTLEQLHQVEIDDELGYDVPVAAIPLIPRLKHQLLHLFEHVLKDGGPDLTATDAQRQMARKLRHAGIQVHDNTFEDSGYGYIYKVEVKQPAGDHDLLVFRTTIGIACGEDSSLYVFQRLGSTWHKVIAIESNGYKEVKGALDDLHYGVSPPDDQGRWFLVYAHDFPRCISAWNGIEYLAIRPGPTATRPAVLVRRTENMYLDDLPKLTVERNWFAVKFETGDLTNSGPRMWVRTVQYQIVGERAIRISGKRKRP